ncbi:hypothetical protein A2303_00255 [Candidatus Falkowbacteria bacterium RIFOXYB2_FULL_47_14]|uniref:Uncharacterized protein n=1 Tax=Candidatus Falkowbacteria bacterium RIFOXYA2_FULL_47_19 TaxID=1797994 RepID=A0A1F5SP31_9BACT|nr:MAG: hypothetical protein A2227_05470 [Candidatus Falkowbacteria bacterium RIFOXYA2_FULL_47_19]OGF36627.1 MAG: hypothetical protein A2468_06425 [Candidatus Falkowbacteria bacterium RIFOXYC2_FULL_46_15]OGF42990.1 MAG: hypothetical protein A2303_00255 [Candidatus Falkowbacteria bacterium RIFOXYB2_FULL_47_14]
MPSPTLSRKTDQKNTLVEDATRLFRVVYQEQARENKSDDEVAKIKVSDLISKMAFYYEKIRNTVDYKEEHLLRKNAIERILRRQIIIEGAIAAKGPKAGEIARELLTELIRAAYLPNNAIPESKIEEISEVVDKYLKLKQYLRQSKELFHEKNHVTGWLISLLACEVEEKLGRSETDLTIVDFMYDILSRTIELPENSPYQNDREIQIYVSIHRCYLKFDRDMLSFILFKHYNPHWKNTPSQETIEIIARKMEDMKERIEKSLDHPLAGQLNRIIGKYNVFFSILKDVIIEDPRGVYDGFAKDPKAFARSVKKVCNKRYLTARKKLWRSAARSIIYIFITKSIFAIILEVPANKWFGEELNPVSLLINISFPALLLFMIVLFTRLPSEANSSRIAEGVEEVIFNEKKNRTYKLRPPVKRSKLMHTTFKLIYMVTFFLSFGTIVWVLDKLNFSWISIVIFLFFLAFVSFFSIRIRKNAKDLLIVEREENILSLLADFFYVPIVEAGKWLSEKFSRINVFVFILDFIIEAPFKIFVTIAEEWTKYVRERKDEI